MANVHWWTAEQLTTLHKCAYILMSASPKESREEILAGLPSAKDCVICSLTGEKRISLSSYVEPFGNTLLACASVCDWLGHHGGTLAYAAAGLETDISLCVEELGGPAHDS